MNITNKECIIYYLTVGKKPKLEARDEYKNIPMIPISFVAALPEGEAFIINRTKSTGLMHNVWRLNAQGKQVENVYKFEMEPYCIGGLFVLHQFLYVIFGNGTLVEISINGTQPRQTYDVPDVGMLRLYGSYFDPSVVNDTEVLLLADEDKGEIISYSLSSRQKVVHLAHLHSPTSVSYTYYKSALYHVVCEYDTPFVSLYNSKWVLYRSFERSGKLPGPPSAMGFSNGIVIISDNSNNHISVFSFDGRLIKKLLTPELRNPRKISLHFPYLWVIAFNGLFKYKLY